MADPKTKAEFESLYHSNARVSGYGALVTQHLPCPFCAAPDWLDVPIAKLALEGSQKVFGTPRTCVECKRTAKVLVAETASMTSMRLLLIEGDEPAEYLRGTYSRDPSTAPTLATVTGTTPPLRKP